ncbi:hypothetical protein, partial [Lysobacter sp. Root690]|uniref:hypothetical protein n=1 Tax=Lysobacter sp. Root690 TaxID=1736588 RepID=UPI001F3973AB
PRQVARCVRSSADRAQLLVILAKAGIQRLQNHAAVKPWIPAFAGMTASNWRHELSAHFGAGNSGVSKLTDSRPS